MTGGISPYLLAPFFAWLVAQIVKFFFRRRAVKDGVMDIYHLYRAGGMPSAHTAVVVSLATIVWQKNGFESVEFGIAAILALVVIYDAMNVRYIVGEQGKLIEKLLQGHPELKGIHAPKIIRGHTFGEVLGGTVLGVIIAFLILFAQNP